MHEVGRVVEQALALGQVLVDEEELLLLQVAQAAVDELRRLRRRARREVVALDEGRAQAARGGVEGHAGAGDAAADHEDVELLVAQAGERRVAVEWRARRHCHYRGSLNTEYGARNPSRSSCTNAARWRMSSTAATTRYSTE